MLQVSTGLGYDEAVAKLPELERIAGLNQDNYEDLQNYGAHLFAAGYVPESIVQFDKALVLRPISTTVLLNLGMAYKELGELERSHGYIERAYELDKDEFWYGRLAWAESLLRMGRWREAWPIYEKARFTKKGMRDASNVPSNLSLWTPQVKPGLQDCPDGKQVPMLVYVMGEGGWGDRINYSRYLVEMAKLGVPFYHNIDCGFLGDALKSIFDRQGFLGTKLEVGMPVCFTHWNTVFGLPAAFETTIDNVPQWPKPWVADPELVEKFKELRSTNGKPTLGLIWNAGEAFEGKRKFRSLTEWQAARLVLETQDKFRWVNLQYGWRPESSPLINLPEFKTWEHTMAGMAHCDGIVSVDTGPMHLAGAMGKPLWVLLPGNSDWKFLLNREDSVWYPSAKLWRNHGQGFEEVLTRMIKALKEGYAPHTV